MLKQTVVNHKVDIIGLRDQKSSLVPIELNRDAAAVQDDNDTSSSKKGRTKKNRCFHWLKANLFLLLTFVGIIAGILIGLTVRPSRPGPDTLIWIGMPGDLYMRILQVMILPLIVCSVIDGTANTDPKSNGRIGLVTMSYIVITNALGCIVGITLCHIINPGSSVAGDDGGPPPDTRNLQTVDIFVDFIRFGTKGKM